MRFALAAEADREGAVRHALDFTQWKRVPAHALPRKRRRRLVRIDPQTTDGPEPAGPGGVPPIGIGAGANLRVPGGWRRIENLRRGDLVVTRDHGMQPVRRIWKQTVAVAAMRADPALAPIRFRPRAIGPMMPRRDVLLGGGHRVLVPACCLAGARDARGRLIAAGEIAGRSDAVHADLAARVTYHVLVFDCPQVVQAEGLPVESFEATASALAGLAPAWREDLLQLFPELAKTASAYPPAEYAGAPGTDYRPSSL